MSCFNFEAVRPFSLSGAVLARLRAEVSRIQPAKPSLLRKRSIRFALPSFIPPTSTCGENRGRAAFALRCVALPAEVFERLQPVPGFRRRILFLRIDEQQRQRGFLEKELMDQAVIFLPGQIPQQRFPFQRVVRRERQVQPPNVHPVGAIANDVLVLDQAMRQRGLADGPFAKQDDLGVHVTAKRRLGRWRGANPCEAIDVYLTVG